MLSESERALAIREGHRNAADAAYFNERPHLADDNGIRVFDAGFDRGWDAACAGRDARIAELEQQRDAAWEALAKIGDFAHDRSTGPAVPDALWEIRAMAYTAEGPAISAAIKEQT